MDDFERIGFSLKTVGSEGVEVVPGGLELPWKQSGVRVSKSCLGIRFVLKTVRSE